MSTTARVFVPRDDPDSWKTEPGESAPAVPLNSKLIDVPIRDLELRYNVKIHVQEGNKEVLRPHSLLYVTGLDLAVDEFTDAVTAIT